MGARTALAAVAGALILCAVSAGAAAAATTPGGTPIPDRPYFRATSIQGKPDGWAVTGNSLDAFVMAALNGVRTVETDWHLSSERRLVAAHDPHLGGDCGNVAQRTVAELRECRLPDGSRIATLDDILRMPFDEVYLDLKDTLGASDAKILDAVEAAIEAVQAGDRSEDAVLMLYRTTPAALSAIEEAGVRAALKGYPADAAQTMEIVREAASLGFEAVCVNIATVSAEVIRESADLGVWHLAWTGKYEPALWKQRASEGLGGLISSWYPVMAGQAAPFYRPPGSASVAGPAMPVAEGMTSATPSGADVTTSIAFRFAGAMSPPAAAPRGSLGSALGMSGDTAVVGSWVTDSGTGAGGSARAYRRGASGWAPEADLVAGAVDDGDTFGWAVAVDGDRAIVGAPGTDRTAGAAYVFVRTAGSWSLEATLAASDAHPRNRFGRAVAIDGDVAVVGADGPTADGFAGAVYVFRRAGGTWAEKARLTRGGAGARFGSAVAVSGESALIGAPGEGLGTGAAYVFEGSGGAWTQTAKLVADDGKIGDELGGAVALDGSTAVVGARGDDWGPHLDAGSAYVFGAGPDTWAQEKRLAPTEGGREDFFGTAVAVEGGRVVVGGVRNSGAFSRPRLVAGSAHVFGRHEGHWTEEQRLSAPAGARRDLFGVAVAVSGGEAAAGAWSDHDAAFSQVATAAYSQSAPDPEPPSRPADPLRCRIDADQYDDALLPAAAEDVGGAVDTGRVHALRGSAALLETRGQQLWWQSRPDIATGAGSERGDAFGTATACGDFDADGHADVAIGAPGEDVGAIADAGSVHVVYGSASGLAAAGSQMLWQGAAGVADSAEAEDRWAAALAVGDFDGDGFADLAVGAPGEDVGGARDAGAVQVLYGSAGGLSASRSQPWTQTRMAVAGTAGSEPGDELGDALAAGDFDGDGADDLAAGAPGEDTGTVSDGGMVNVLPGGAESGLRADGAQARWQGAGGIGDRPEPGDAFGGAVVAGAFDRDARADLVVGVPGEDVGDSAADAGVLHLVRGEPGGLSTSASSLFAQGAGGIRGAAESGDFLGGELAAGDFDGDGDDDVVAAVAGEDVGATADAGALTVLRGSSTGLNAAGNQLLHQGSGLPDTAEPGDRLGTALLTGDFDGDTRTDLLVGAAGEDRGPAADAGALHVMAGSSGGLTASRVQTWAQGTRGLADTAERFDALGHGRGSEFLPGGETIVGAGDIASCSSAGDEATATLLDRIAGTVVTFGDNVYPNGSEAEFASCYAPSWGRHKARTRPSPGNHDYLTAGGTGYFGYFGAAAGDPSRGYYSYDRGAWHVVALNSNCQQVGGCGAGSAQVEWLNSDLAANPRTCTLAYFHHPRFSSGNHGSSAGMDELWKTLVAGGADVVAAGHDHNYERFAPLNGAGAVDRSGGARSFVVGTGGMHPIAPGPPLPASESLRSHTSGVLKLTLHPAGYDWRFVPEAGRSFSDSGSGSCH